MINTTTVYGLLSSRSPDEIRYIGQTTRSIARRLSQHLTYAKKRRTAVQLWIDREMKDGYEIILRVLVANAVFDKTEMHLIAEYRKSGSRLLNHTEGGGGVLGHSPNDETRKKKSVIAKAYWANQTDRVRWHPTEEQKKKISDAKTGRPVPALRGRKHTEETKRKMRKWAAVNREWLRERNRGQKRSQETRKKMSESRLQYWANKMMERAPI